MTQHVQNLTTEDPPMDEEAFEPISDTQPFCFSCSPQVPCFNDCCRDLNQFLYPYDVMRLKNHLNISSTRFLAQYVRQHVGPASGLPVLSLQPTSARDPRCPFVTESGCSVYPDRPASCRLYPVARAVTRRRETGRMQSHFALIRERHCRGFESGAPKTAATWMADQGLDDYNRINDRLLEIIRRKNERAPGPLSFAQQRIVIGSLYDLDAFRGQVFEENALGPMAPDPATLARAQFDETVLLELGHQWVLYCLFGP